MARLRADRVPAAMPEGAPKFSSVTRARDRLFCALAATGCFPLSDELTPENLASARQIATQVWPETDSWNEKAVLKKVRRKLREPDVREAIGLAYEAAGFTVVDAIDAHIAHIRGIQHEVIDAKGKRRTVKTLPSYPALRDYQKMTFLRPLPG